MMNFQKFTEMVLKEVREKAEDGFDVRTEEVTKNNDTRLTGMYATTKGSNISPCIYLDRFYEEYKEGGMEFKEAVDEIYRMLTKHLADMPPIDISGFLNWEKVKGSIYAKLVNAEQNKEQLEIIPHRMFLDLAVVYYTLVRVGEEEDGTILIYNSHMEAWEQDEEALYGIAMENMRADGAADFVGMETVMKQIFPDAAVSPEDRKCEAEMYILTNGRKKFGAAELLDQSTLRRVADEVGDGFIVLPSSVHESIILRPCRTVEYGRLADMVREVNDTQVDMEERLSYHVYVYSRDEERLKIVA